MITSTADQEINAASRCVAAQTGDHHDKLSSRSGSGRIIESMVALVRCSMAQRIIVAGSKSVEITHEMTRRGFEHVAASANCGKAAGQYDVALVDWRRRTPKDLEPMLDWLVGFLGPEGAVVVWMDPQRAVVRQNVCSMLERRGFVLGETAIHDHGSAVSGKLHVAKPLPKAA